MAVIATISLNDGATVPAAHSFEPMPDIMSNLARWVDKIGGIALGYPTVSLMFKMPTKASRAFKIQLKVVTPVLEVTSPTTTTGIQPGPTLSFNLLANVDFVLPERSTLQQRKDLLAYLKNMLATPVVTNAVQAFEPVW